MSEALTETIKEGYKNWKNNLVLGVPHFTGTALSIAIIIAACIAAGIVFTILQPKGGIEALPDPATLLIPALILSIGLLLIVFVTCYFCAAGIGMSVKAIETGKTEARDMFSNRGGNAISIFLSLIILAIASVAALIIALAPAGIAYYMRLWGVGTGLLVAGCVLYLSYLAALSFMYTMTPVSIVVKNLGAVEGIKEGGRFALKNKLLVFLFWGFYLFVSEIFGSLFSIITGPLNYIGMIIPPAYVILFLLMFLVYSVIVLFTLTPLFYVYATRIYLSANPEIKKTASRQYAHTTSRAQSSTQRELYI